MEKLIIIRHGNSQHNEKLTKDLDSQLTELGVNQATKVGKNIKKYVPDIEKFKCFTSPFLRCLRTSELISIHNDKPLKFKIFVPINECKTSYPKEGCKVPNRQSIFSDFDWEDCPKMGWHFFKETYSEMVNRLRKALEILPSRALVVSHGTPVLTLAKLASNQDVQNPTKWNDDIKNCSLTVVENGKIIHLGNTDYLN